MKIIFKNDIKREVNIFWKYLYLEKKSFYKWIIFKKFPKLELILEKTKTEDEQKKEIENYIISYRYLKKNIIEKAEQEERIKLSKKGEKVLLMLSKIMEFTFDKETEYTIISSILPFSPFEKNSFYFSILSKTEEAKKQYNDILFLLAHEVSHFILFDILRSKQIKLYPHELYFLKEILAVIVLKDKPLIDILCTENYKGNNILHRLCVRDGVEVKNIVEYFEKVYSDKKIQGSNFEEYLDLMIEKIRSISGALKHKYSLWMDKKPKSGNEQDFLKNYRRAIPLDSKVDKT